VAVGVEVGVIDGVALGVPVGVAVGVTVTDGVELGVAVGVIVGVSVGVCDGVCVGVFVGLLVGVIEGVAVGVFVGVFVAAVPLNALTTSPAEDPLLFHVAKICEPPLDDRCADTAFGEFAALTLVGLDHEVYGLAASEYFTVPPSTNHVTRFDDDEYNPEAREVVSPLNTDVAALHDAGEPE